MSTRFYFSATEYPNIAPTPSANWEFTTGYFQGTLKPQPEAQFEQQQPWPIVAKGVTTNPYDMMRVQFISESLPSAGTLSGTFDLVVAAGETSATDDIFLQCIIRVVDSTGSTVRGTAYAGATQTTVVSTLGAQNQELPTAPEFRYWSAIALSSVSYQAGDRIVVEVGGRSVNATAAGSFTVYASDNDLLSLPYDAQKFITVKGTGLGVRSWIEFSADLFASLNVEEYKFMDDGIVLNTGPTLPFVDLTQVDGVDSADVRLQTHDREGIHGGYASSEFESLRTVTLEGNVYASPASLETYLDSLKANFAPTHRDRKLYFNTDAGLRFVYGKSQGIRFGKTSDRGRGVVPFQVQIVCQDPRMYSAAEVVVTGTSSPSNAQTFQNITVAGDRDTPAVIRIFGPTTGPSNSLFLLNSLTYFSAANSLTNLAANEFDMFDLDKHTVMKNYLISDRSNWVIGGPWPNLQPGVNRISFTHTAGTGTAFAWSVTYRPAWR